MRSSYRFAAFVIIVAAFAFAAGKYFSASSSPSKPAKTARRILYYVDPMHPSYRSDKPGVAPDCNMDLEPVYEGDDTATSDLPGAVKIDARAQQMIGLQTAVVRERHGVRTLETTGKIAVDETRTQRISALVDGVVRMTAPIGTGSIVKKDEVLATYFVASRDLYNAVQAFFLASSNFDQAATNFSSRSVMDPSKAQARVEEELLKSYGMTAAQIKDLVRTREVTRDIEFRSPVNGIVLERAIEPGITLTRGTPVFRIADLSKVWVLADVYENDADRVKPGARAHVTYGSLSLPAIVTSAMQFDAASRTLKVRLEMDNPRLMLRPDMFVRISIDTREPEGLTVPADAVIDSGARKVVYVSNAQGAFEPREVKTGIESGGRVQIVAGLKEGETIAVTGTFMLDSESRLQLAAQSADAPKPMAKPAVEHKMPMGSANMSSKDDKMPMKDDKSEIVDPVCGMPISKDEVKFTISHEGQDYHFCSKSCKDKFEKDPAKYTAKKDSKMASAKRGGASW